VLLAFRALLDLLAQLELGLLGRLGQQVQLGLLAQLEMTDLLAKSVQLDSLEAKDPRAL
jgi:hypothetical protein